MNSPLALYGRKNEFARNNPVLPPISEVSTEGVSLEEKSWLKLNIFANMNYGWTQNVLKKSPPITDFIIKYELLGEHCLCVQNSPIIN